MKKEAYGIIDRLLLTEKGTHLQQQNNQYLFRVRRDAAKKDIKEAVESIFKVQVTGVRTMNRPGKKKRERTMNFGRTAAWKRAVVTLKAGDSIDLT